jgi:hypothetical protein
VSEESIPRSSKRCALCLKMARILFLDFADSKNSASIGLTTTPSAQFCGAGGRPKRAGMVVAKFTSKLVQSANEPICGAAQHSTAHHRPLATHHNQIHIAHGTAQPSTYKQWFGIKQFMCFKQVQRPCKVQIRFAPTACSLRCGLNGYIKGVEL